MPAFAKHQRFVATWPCRYEGWYTIWEKNEQVGSAYLTHGCEVGLFIKEGHKSQGLGAIALGMLKEKHRKPKYYANIAPGNEVSARFFERHGFKMIQRTYELEMQ